MARTPRLAVAGELHLLLQRGHSRRAVFVDDADRLAYLGMLNLAARHSEVTIHAYALLDAEVHLLATPRQADSLSRMMQSLGRRYVAAFNRRHERSGTLWDGRFRAAVIDGAVAGSDALVYVEALAVRAGLVAAAGEWRWSSAAHHLGLRRDTLVVEHPAYWSLGNTPFERESAHAHRLTEGLEPEQVARFDRAVMQGRAVGSQAFREGIGRQTGLAQQARPRGRPPRGSAGSHQKHVPN
jgi:putative transposase